MEALTRERARIRPLTGDPIGDRIQNTAVAIVELCDRRLVSACRPHEEVAVGLC